MLRERKGSALIEFVFLGIPSLFLTISVFQVSMTFWQYHTIAEAAAQGARYAATHGSDCAQGTNTCTTTAKQVASAVAGACVGLDPTKVTVTLTPQSGTTIGPYALSDCVAGNANAPNCTGNFPPSSLTPPNTISVKLTFKATNPFVMLWPGAGKMLMANGLTLGAVSTQELLF